MALFIGRLPFDADRRELERVFDRYGRLVRCEVKRGVRRASHLWNIRAYKSYV